MASRLENIDSDLSEEDLELYDRDKVKSLSSSQKKIPERTSNRSKYATKIYILMNT